MATIQNPNDLQTVVTGLTTGATAFRFSVTDNFGRVTYGVVNVTVAAGANLAVDAGEDQYLDENVSTTNFYGTVTVLTPGTTAVSYTWSVVTSGVTGVVFSTPNAINTGVSGIPVAARTTFRLSVVGSDGQTYTSDIDVSVAAPSRMYYEDAGVPNAYDPDNTALLAWAYEPQGYDPLRPGGYPCLLYYHGLGSNGENTTPLNDIMYLVGQGAGGADEDAGLPKFLYNQDFPMQCIVIAPQLETGFWDEATTLKAITWAQGKFNIDPDRLYTTGYSSGGGGVLEVSIADNTLFAAGISCNTVYNSLADVGNAELVKNIPFLFVAGYNDTQVPCFGDHVTGPSIDALNSVSPKGYVSPYALIPWAARHDWSSWNFYCWDKRRAPFDFETDFLLFYNKDVNKTMTNFVVRAETRKTWLDYSVAVVNVGKMPAGATKTSLQARLATLLTDMTTTAGHRYWFLNLGSTTSYAGYKVNNVPTTSTTLTNMPDVKNAASGLGFTITSSPGGVATDGLQSDSMGMLADMFSTSFVINAASSWKITGVDPTKVYDVFLYCTDKSQQYFSTGNRTGVYSICNGDQVQSRYDGYNTMFTTEHWNVVPNGSNELVLTLVNPYASYGRVVAIMIREKATGNVRANFGKFNMVNDAGAANVDWGSLIGDPTTAVRSCADPVSGWTINTVNTGVTYWQKFTNGAWANNTGGPDVDTYPTEFPKIVARSNRFNYQTNFDPVAQNYNLECIGTPGMGLPAGYYRVKVFSSTTNTFEATRVVCKIGQYSGDYEYNVTTTNNTTKYLTFYGMVKEGETIKIGIFMANDLWGVAYVNGIIVEKLY